MTGESHRRSVRRANGLVQTLFSSLGRNVAYSDRWISAAETEFPKNGVFGQFGKPFRSVCSHSAFRMTGSTAGLCLLAFHVAFPCVLEEERSASKMSME